MAKKFRNTKARRREIERFDTLFKQTKNKVYYRRKKHNVDFQPYLPIQSKKEIRNMSTKEIQKMNRELTKINDKKSSFFEIVHFERGSFPKILHDQIIEAEKKIMEKTKVIDERDAKRPIIIGRDEISNDTVLSQRLMGKPNLTLSSNIKPYDFNKPTDVKSLESALQVRLNRLDPEWHLERQEIMKENYINSLITLFNDEADTVVEKLKNVPAKDFYELYQQFEAIDFVYVPSDKRNYGDDEEEALHLLDQILDDYFDGKIDTRGKVFN